MAVNFIVLKNTFKKITSYIHTSCDSLVGEWLNYKTFPITDVFIFKAKEPLTESPFVGYRTIL